MAHLLPLWIVPLVLLAASALETAQPDVCDDAVGDEVAALQLKANHNSSLGEIDEMHYVIVEYHGIVAGYHTETMICPKAKFSRRDQEFLEGSTLNKMGGQDP
ncbi:unnamed protein product [Polarella glacialis]|uniref:Subtilisin n=1 Tax=Polarella glacialis TaxID=89957 RepID=A0A813DHY0_POLGL|nr:unnamed protein product [Polarella glacialis]CAE8585196.1 unnamed protein product [Polarella glacialis]